MSLRFKINLIIAVIALITFLLASALTVLNARNAVIDEVTSTLELAQKFIGESDQQENIIQFNKVRHLRVAVATGQTAPHVSLLSTQKVQGVPSLFVGFVEPDKEYLTRKLTSATNEEIFLIADPSDEIQEAWKESKLFLGLLLLLTLVISTAVFFVLGRALKPVNNIIEGLSEIESGHYQKRLPDFELPEFSSISRSFNTMAKNLDKSQKENRRLSEKMLNLREDERRFLARELHDEMGQSLSGMKALTASARAFDSPAPVKENLSVINSICDDLFKVVRSMMEQLRPPVLDELGLIPALEELVQKWQSQTDQVVSLDIDSSITDLKARSDIHLFRIVQESITNSVKHSQAKEISVNISETSTDYGESIEIHIVDNGIGFDPNLVRDGTGLNSIRERVASLGAKLDIQSRKDVGTVIKISLPGDIAHEKNQTTTS